MNNLLERISIDPSVCFGKPCIKGTRIWVSMIFDLLNSDLSSENIIKEYPQLTEEDLHAVIAYSKQVGTPNNQQEPWWITQAGVFKDDYLFDEMIEAGQKYRKAQVDAEDIKK